MATMVAVSSHAHAVVLSFDDIEPSCGLGYFYQERYGVVFMSNFGVADHSASSWGAPRSGTNVLVVCTQFSFSSFGFKRAFPQSQPPASSVGGFFSTEPGTVLRLLAYSSSRDEDPVASGTIGGPDVSWENVYVQMVATTDTVRFVDLVP